MEYTDKELFKMALANFTSNAEEVFEEVYNDDNWSDVVLWEPFENYETNDVHEMVTDLQSTFINIRDRV